MTPLSDPQRQAIENEILAGRHIAAIKLYRDAAGVQLVEAKKAVEDMEVDLRRRSPESFRAGAAKSGCFSMALCAVILIASAALMSRLGFHS